jgi:hypothetical protein
MYVLPYFTHCTILHACQVIELIELMVAWDDKYLLIVLRSPVPERMNMIILITQVSDVSGKNEDGPIYFKRMFT